MADRIDDMAELHGIIFETPDSSDDFFSSWSDYSESESAAMPRGFEQRERASTSTAPARRVLVGRRRQQQRAAQQNPPIEWSATNERFVVQYPEFRGPEHGQTFDFEVDSLPVVFFDALLTNELWDLLVTETNRYARRKIEITGMYFTESKYFAELQFFHFSFIQR